MKCVIELSKGQRLKLLKSRNLGTKLPGETEKKKGGYYYLKTTSKKLPHKNQGYEGLGFYAFLIFIFENRHNLGQSRGKTIESLYCSGYDQH